ncbi:MAG TPA: zinc-finger domain-containing protein [Candidatus Cybelea sp.]|nr:zinc-finger domain-containing protein [Candidatus Cybelea sp.]
MAKEPVETVEVSTTRVACDGGPGVLGHPKVYLNLAKDGAVDCPYCGKRFVLKAGAKAEAH